MVDVMAIQGAISGLQTAGQLAKGLLQLHSLADVQTKVIDLQEAILTAQASALDANAEQFAMIQRARELEKEIADVKAWEETKQRYQLISPLAGFHVYALKEASKGTEPPHWVCAHCYEDGRKEILQNVYVREGRKTLVKCPRCNFELDSLHRTEDIERQYIS